MSASRRSSAKAKGICYLVGAGPGDLGLMTLRAKECVELAEVLVYDYLCNPQILRWARPDADLIYAGKKAGEHTMSQDEINATIVKRAKEGKAVVRLKGGDPMVFGRGGEEAEELRAAGIPFEIVPGISSTIAGPAYAGIPVTHRQHNTALTIFTGHEDPTKPVSLDYAKLAKAEGTKVMLMGIGRIKEIAGAFIANGAAPDTPVALVRWATTPRQQTLVGTLKNIAAKVKKTGFAAPAVVVIGSVVALHKKIGWFENRPLFGKRIVVTRTRKQAGVLSRQLEALGADVYELPTIRIEPPVDLRDFAELVKDAHTYDWLVFTSPNGVDAFFEWFDKLYDDARSIGGVRIAAIGPGTATRIKEHRLAVDLMPEKDFVAEGLIAAFKEKEGGVENLNVLWVKAEKTRDVLGKALQEMGAIVDEAIAYRTVAETGDPLGAQARLAEEGADMITFTSSSTVEHFMDLDLPWPEGMEVASIGPVTSQTATELGLEVTIEAERHDIPGLVQAIVDHYR